MIKKTKYQIKESGNLSPRVKWLRDYYFKGVDRKWNNEYNCFTTGTPWDIQHEETTYYIVPEVYVFFEVLGSSIKQNAHEIKLNEDFWSLSIPERRAGFTKKAIINYVPQEIFPDDLLAEARFNMMASRCWTREEAEERNRLVYGKNGASHTITFNPSLLRDEEHCQKFKAFLRGYAENGGNLLTD